MSELSMDEKHEQKTVGSFLDIKPKTSKRKKDKQSNNIEKKFDELHIGGGSSEMDSEFLEN